MAEKRRMIRPTMRITTQETTYRMEKTRRYKEVVMVEREGNGNGGAFSFEFNGLYMNDCGATGTTSFGFGSTTESLVRTPVTFIAVNSE